jgi:hypothetical protein
MGWRRRMPLTEAARRIRGEVSSLRGDRTCTPRPHALRSALLARWPRASQPRAARREEHRRERHGAAGQPGSDRHAQRGRGHHACTRPEARPDQGRLGAPDNSRKLVPRPAQRAAAAGPELPVGRDRAGHPDPHQRVTPNEQVEVRFQLASWVPCTGRWAASRWRRYRRGWRKSRLVRLTRCVARPTSCSRRERPDRSSSGSHTSRTAGPQSG